jgi:nicotinamidase-related amidase
MSSVLVLVDIQNDYFPGGTMELIGINEATENARAILKDFRMKNLPVIHVQHVSHYPGATFFLPGTHGSEIHPLLSPSGDEPVVVKNFPNSFRDTSLLEMLNMKKPDNLVICGAMSHICIDATVRAAFDLGFNCIVAEDACATRDLIFKGKTIKASDVHASFMVALSSPYAKVITTKEIIGSNNPTAIFSD